MTRRQRLFAFAFVAGVSAVIAVMYGLRAARTETAPPSTPAAAVGELMREPHLLFRNTRQGSGYGRLVVVSLNDAAGPRYETPLSCDRVDFAGGVGVCLAAGRGIRTTYSAVIFDGGFAPLHTLPLAGIPSRVRVSPDGRLAGVTTFVSGHSYADGAFSTETLLVDTRGGKPLADLESFEVTRDGRPFKREDFNFWGVTFTRDSNSFYATLSSGGVIYLIRAEADSRRARVIGTGVECPSLSPDNQRIAFKKRQTIDGRLVWRLALLDLTTNTERVLEGETASVDDQVTWLDDRRILYSTPHPSVPGSMVISAMSIDGGPKQAFVHDAYSPALGSDLH